MILSKLPWIAPVLDDIPCFLVPHTQPNEPTLYPSCLSFAKIVFEDTYLMINDTDGPEYADIARRRMNSGKRPYMREGKDASEATELLYHDEFSV